MDRASQLIEQIYGSGRALVMYVGTGVVGSLSSLLFSGPTMSVLGVLGALITELSLARSTYPQRWRKMLLGKIPAWRLSFRRPGK